MKKLFTLLLALAAVVGCWATETPKSLDLSILGEWTGQSTVKYTTITANGWKGATLYYGNENPLDATGYEQVKLELAEACAQKVSLTVYYTDGTFTTAYIEAGSTSCVAELTKYAIDHINVCNYSTTDDVVIKLKNLSLVGKTGTRTAEDAYADATGTDLENWNGSMWIGKDKFANANAGAKLIFTYTEDDATTYTYHQICTQDGNYNKLEGNGGQVIGLENGTTTYAMELTANDVDLLKENDFRATGYGITITKVELVYYDAAATEQTKALDLSLMNGWTNESTYDYASVYADGWAGGTLWYGDQTPLDATGYEQVELTLKDACTQQVAMEIYYTDGSHITNYIAAGNYKCVAELTKYGIRKIDIRNWSGVDNTRISLYSILLKGTRGTRTANAIYENVPGTDLGNWTANLSIAKENFANAVAGAKLIFNYTDDANVPKRDESGALVDGETVECTYHQICTQDGNWNKLKGNGGAVIDLTSGMSSYAMELTAADVDSLQKYGFVASGYGITITKVELAYNELPSDEIDLRKHMTGWNATYDIENQTITWSDDQWGGCGWSFSTAKDYSDYYKVVYEFDGAAPAAGGVEVHYSAGSGNSWGGFNQYATAAKCILDPTRYDAVNAIYLKLGAAESLKLKKVYLAQMPSVRLNAEGFATFSCDANVAIATNGVKAYKAAINDQDNEIVLTEITGNIPAGTGVILYGTAGTEVEFTVAASADEITDNDLHATTTYAEDIVAMPASGNVWVLNPAASTFAHYAGTSFIANRAYLEHVYVNNAAPMRMVFGKTQPTQLNENEYENENVKFMKDGRLYIRHNGQLFDASGKVIK